MRVAASAMERDPASPDIARRGAIGSALLIIAVAFAARWPFLRVPMISDEGAYAYIARLWTGGTLLYRDLPLDRPQGLFLLYKAALSFGGSIVSIRLFAAAYHALTSVAVWALSRELFGARAAIVAGVAAGVFGAAPGIEGFTANAEGFTLLPLVLSAHAAWRGRWALAGALSGIAVCIKPSAASGLLLVLCWAILAARARAPALAAALLAFSAPVAASLAHGWLTGWDAYVGAFVDRRLRLYSVIGSPLPTQLAKLASGLQATMPVWIAPAVATATALAIRGARDRRMQLVVAWFASSWPAMAIGGEWHWHYFQQIIPPLAVGAAGLADVKVSRAARAAVATAVALAAGVFLSEQAPQWLLSPTELSWKLYHRPAYLVQERIAQEIRTRTSPHDRIYVAVAEAELYYLSDRVAVVPQLFRLELLDTALRQRVVNALGAGEPELVVAFQPIPGMPTEEFRALLAPNYTRVTDVAGVPLFQRTSSSRTR